MPTENETGHVSLDECIAALTASRIEIEEAMRQMLERKHRENTAPPDVGLPERKRR